MIPPDFTIPKSPEEGAGSNPAPAAPVAQAAKKSAGRPKNPNKPVGVTVYLTPDEWAYLETWNPTNASYAARELIEDLKRIRPTGRHSAPKADQAGRLAPGSKTQLKKALRAANARVAALEAQVAKLKEGRP